MRKKINADNNAIKKINRSTAQICTTDVKNNQQCFLIMTNNTAHKHVYI